MIRQHYEEWPDQQVDSPYPFVDGATLTDTSRELVLQRSYVVDARLWPDTASSRIHLRQIERSDSGLTFAINDLSGLLMTAEVDLEELSSVQKLVFRRVSNGQPAGWIRFSPGAIQNLYDSPNGVYRFTPQATEFCSTVVSPVRTGGVTGFLVDGQEVTGDVVFFGGRGVELAVEDGSVVVHAVGDPYARRDACQDPVRSGALLNPLRRIRVVQNGVSVGNVVPSGGTLLATVATSDREVRDADGRIRRAEGFHSPGPNGELLVRVIP